MKSRFNLLFEEIMDSIKSFTGWSGHAILNFKQKFMESQWSFDLTYTKDGQTKPFNVTMEPMQVRLRGQHKDTYVHLRYPDFDYGYEGQIYIIDGIKIWFGDFVLRMEPATDYYTRTHNPTWNSKLIEYNYDQESNISSFKFEIHYKPFPVYTLKGRIDLDAVDGTVSFTIPGNVINPSTNFDYEAFVEYLKTYEPKKYKYDSIKPFKVSDTEVGVEVWRTWTQEQLQHSLMHAIRPQEYNETYFYLGGQYLYQTKEQQQKNYSQIIVLESIRDIVYDYIRDVKNNDKRNMPTSFYIKLHNKVNDEQV